MIAPRDVNKYPQFTVAKSFEVAAACGMMGDISTITIRGRNSDIGTALEDMWVVGGIMSWPTVASPISLVSSSAADSNTTTAAGTRKIRIEGLLAGFTATTEDVALNGTTTVTSSNSFIRMNRGYAIECGQYDGSTISTHGTIQFTHGSTLTGRMGVENGVAMGETQLARYTVPTGYNAIIVGLSYAIQSSKVASIYGFYRSSADVIAQPYKPKRILFPPFDSAQNNEHFDFHAPSCMPEKTDIWLSAIATGVGTGVTAQLDLILYRSAA